MIKKGILISIQPPWTKKIMNKSKKFECRKLAINSVVPGAILYIYETKNNGGSGKIIGQATIKDLWRKSADDYYLGKKGTYALWCCDLFDPILAREIGFNNDKYLIELCDVIKYEKPLELFNFIYESDGYKVNFNKSGNAYVTPVSNDRVARPPQNMCNVILIDGELNGKN